MEYFKESSPESITPNITEESARMLGALGFYWAELDKTVQDHPEDEQWIIQSNN